MVFAKIKELFGNDNEFRPIGMVWMNIVACHAGIEDVFLKVEGYSQAVVGVGCTHVGDVVAQ